MSYPKINAAQLKVYPLAQRRSFIKIDEGVLDPAAPPPELNPKLDNQINRLAKRIIAARASGAAVMFAYGAHLIKNLAGPLVNALIEDGFVTHLATQGAGVIHDWEFAFHGASSESVRDNAPVGRFGAWDETGRWINLSVIIGAAEGLGFGEAVGKLIAENGFTLPSRQEIREQIIANPTHELSGAKADLLWTMQQFDLPGGQVKIDHPYKSYSVLACAYKHRVPLTVHPGIGYDIIANHPFYHGGAIGRAGTTDARIFAHSVKHLDDGVYMSVGSAIMSPQVFEKAFSAANNLRSQAGLPFIQNHYLAVVDIQDSGGWDWTTGEPPKNNPAYYLRYCKSFYRMGGILEYLQCDNRLFLANLVARLRDNPDGFTAHEQSKLVRKEHRGQRGHDAVTGLA